MVPPTNSAWTAASLASAVLSVVSISFHAVLVSGGTLCGIVTAQARPIAGFI
jgi:hypothetical protein